MSGGFLFLLELPSNRLAVMENKNKKVADATPAAAFAVDGISFDTLEDMLKYVQANHKTAARDANRALNAEADEAQKARRTAVLEARKTWIAACEEATWGLQRAVAAIEGTPDDAATLTGSVGFIVHNGSRAGWEAGDMAFESKLNLDGIGGPIRCMSSGKFANSNADVDKGMTRGKKAPSKALVVVPKS